MHGARWARETTRVITWLSCLWASPAFAGKLSDVREETGSSSDSSSSSDDDDDGDGSFILNLFFDDDDDDDDRRYYYEPREDTSAAQNLTLTLTQPWFYPLYPYRGSVAGNLARRRFTLDAPIPSSCTREDAECQTRERVVACVDGTCYSETAGLDDGTEGAPARVDQVQSARGQLQLDTGTTVDGLWRGTVQGTVDHHRGLGLDTKLTYWVEPQAAEATDSTLLGDVGLRIALFDRPAFQLRLGLGARFQVDTISKAAGFNGSVSAEFYPFEPLVVRLDGDAGTLGEAFVYEGQTSLGVLLMRTEILAGVATLHIGDVSFESAFAGIRFHL